ncbi:hypothetical protein [Streptomyces justiciae]|uniref:hypothetical protein n=1 Tax=Streptomyces justiciae TaxID=2780140 RepID=UPI0021191D85|nr:hypothetical protein [Streptomyces justiciae]MCW8382403.1 hypothetical protein [Streptomyces justiciae]
MDDSLSFESFYEGAQKAAHRAMDDHGRAEYDEFALHAGVAVERLAKAALARMNPAYLVEMRNGNADMLLHFGGHLEIAKDKVRTVGAKEALARLRRLEILPADSELDLLIDLRNGAAHTTGGEDAKALLPALARSVDMVLKHVDERFHTFWGRWTSALAYAMDERETEVRREVHIRIRQARHRFDDRFAGLPEGAKEKVLKEPQPDQGMVIGPMTIRTGEKILFVIGSVPCPACGGNASMTLVPLSESDTSMTMSPDALQCRLCGLELNNLEEIKASGADAEKAMLPSSVSVSYGPTLPFTVHMGETHAG